MALTSELDLKNFKVPWNLKRTQGWLYLNAHEECLRLPKFVVISDSNHFKENGSKIEVMISLSFRARQKCFYLKNRLPYLVG